MSPRPGRAKPGDAAAAEQSDALVNPLPEPPASDQLTGGVANQPGARNRAAPSRQSLLQALHQAHVRVAITSMGAVALVLLLAAVLALRSYASNNLELVARSIAYTVEAAVVFNDRPAIHEQLATVAERESLRSAELFDIQGRRLAHFERERTSGLLAAVGEPLSALLMPYPTVAPIRDRDRLVGQVSLRGDGAVFARFLATAVGGIGLCLLLVGWGLRQSLQRMQQDIVDPIRDLIAMTDSARTLRTGPQRAPTSRILEFHQLGEDFNALLSEIQAQQTQLAQENRSLSRLANHDSLTGLYNRAYFARRLARILQDAQSQGASIAVLYMDNDQFKAVNDQYGHAVGDMLLVEVAQRIRTQLRESDLVARLGGDEFAVLLAPLHQPRDAVRIAEKINAAVAQPLSDYPRIVPSVSIGIALYPQHGESADNLMRAADRAMYQAKKRQRGGNHLFEGHHVASSDPAEM